MSQQKRITPVTFYISISMFAKLENLSRERGESVSSIIREAVEKYLEEVEEE